MGKFLWGMAVGAMLTNLRYYYLIKHKYKK